MTDRAFEPASPNPFDQFNRDSPSYVPEHAAAAPETDNPFEQFNPYPGEKVSGFAQPKQPESSTLGAFGRGAMRNAAPALGGLAAAGTGAELGFAAGTAVGGPLAPITGPVGGLIGGGAAFFGGSAAASAAQHWALSKLPDSWKDALGLDDAQERADNAKQPVASQLGGLTPYMLTMTPMSKGLFSLPENATAFQRLMAHPATARVFGGTVMGGLELGQEAWHGESPDWTKVAISTGFGVIFNRPNRIGEAITKVGAAPVRALLPLALRPRAPVEAPAVETAPAVSPGAPEAVPEAAPAEAAPSHPKVTAENWRKEITEHTRRGQPNELPPTVAQANDMGIMGPGATEETFLGSHVRNSEATQAARENAQTEQDVIGPPPATDLHSRARQLDFDSFQRRDELVAQRDMLEAWLGERHDVAAEGAVTKAQEHLAAIEAELAEVQPNIAAAYRRAEDTVTRRPEPPEAATAEPAPPITPVAPGAAEAAEPRFSIAKDVEERLVAAGRPLEEARAHAAWSEAYWQNYAARFEGRKGTAEDIYRREAPEILGKRASRLQRRSERAPRKVDEEKLSLTQFLAHRGGLAENGDLRAIFDRNPTVPGFGRLLRKGGMPLDRAREAAVEAGYLWDDPLRAGGGSTTPADLLRLLDQEAKGSKVFRVGREDLATAKHDPDEVRAQYESHVTGQLEEAGVPTEMITPERLARTIELMERGSETAEEAFDHAVMKEHLPEREHEDVVEKMYFQFAGQQAAEADLGALGEAKRMAAARMPADQIWKKTGWMKRPDGWKFEINDSEMKFIAPELTGPEETVLDFDRKLPDVIEHGKLFANYPELHDLWVHMSIEDGMGKQATVENGVISVFADNREQALDLLTHEIQHVIQSREGFERGSNPYHAVKINEEALAEVNREIETLTQSGEGHNRLPALHAARTALERSGRIRGVGFGVFADASDQAHQVYWRRAGEVEARNAEARRRLTEIERRETFPEKTQDVAPSDVLRGRDAVATVTEHEDEIRAILKEAIAGRKDHDSDPEKFAFNSLVNRGAAWTADLYAHNVADIARDIKYWGHRIAYDQTARDALTPIKRWLKPSLRNKYEELGKSLVALDGYIKADQDRVGLMESLRDAMLHLAERGFGKPKETLHAIDVEGMLGRPLDAHLPTEMSAPENAFNQRGGILRGKIDLNPDFPHLITMLKGANASTFIHESAHDFLERIKRDARDELAPDALKADAQATLDWLGIKSFDELEIQPNDNRRTRDRKTGYHEQFARGFEAYMMEGRAPSQGMANVFAKVRDWLISIYKQATALKVELTPQIRGVYDRLLGINPDNVVIAPHEPVRAPTLGDIHLTDKQLTEPEHAEPVADLVSSETSRTVEEHHPHVDAEFEAAEQAAAEAAESSMVGPAASGEGGGSAGGAREVGPPRGDDQRVPGGTAGGAANGDLDRSGASPVQESPGVSENGASARADNARQAAGAHPLAASPSDVLRPAAFNVGKSGNVRVENITSVPDLVQAIEESSQRIGGGGRLTMGDMLGLADDLAINAAEVSETHLARMFGGIQNLSAKIYALRTAIRDSAQIVTDAMAKAAKSGSDADLAEMAVAMARHDMMQSVLSSVTTETGRGLGMSFKNLEGWEKAENLKDFLQANTGRTLFQLQRMAKLGAQLDSPGKVSKFLRDAQKRSFGRLMVEYWVNGLISGIATHMTYAEGNAILSLWKAVPETLAAAAVGKAKAAAGFTGERVRFGEAVAGPVAMVRGIPASVQAGVEALRTGQSTLLPGETAKPLTPFEGDTSLVTAKTIHKPEAVTWREAGADAYAMMRSIKDAFVAGSSLLSAGGVPGAPTIGWSHSPLGAIPDIAVRGVNVIPVGSAIRLPGRAVAGIHSFFRTMNYLREGAAEAYRTAASDQNITTSHDFAAKVADVRTNPTEEQMERWRHGATELALMGQGGKFVENLSKFFNTTVNVPGLGETAPLKFIQPFVHIGANVIKQAVVLRTPVGILSSEVRADLMGKNGSLAQDMAAGRMLAGTAVSVLFGTLAMEGFITGSGPKDPNEARAWREVYQAHSVKIGGMWYQVNRLGPMGLLMGLAADMYDVAHEAEEGDMMVAASHLQHAIFQNILDESFMRGPADLIKAVEDPGRYGEAYLKQMISSFVPFSVGMAQMARAMDPYTRETRTVIDAIRAKVPGMSQNLLPRRNIWGEEIPNASAFGGRAFSAIYEKQVNSDPVNQAMLDLAVHPGMPERTIRNIQLTDAQYDDFAKYAGRMTKMRLDAIVRSPAFNTWPNHVKHDVINGVIEQTRESARGFIMAKYPQIPHDATMALRKRKMGEP